MYLLLSHSDILQVTYTRASVATCSCDDHFHWCPQGSYTSLKTFTIYYNWTEITA